MKPSPLASALITVFVASSPLRAQTFINADFEAGTLGFTSDYQYAPTNTIEGQFTVGKHSRGWNWSFRDYGDHTSGAGNMMLVNGATAADSVVWRQTIALPPNKTFRFRAWTGTAVPGGAANLLLKVNGRQIGRVYTLPEFPDSWWPWSQSLTTTSVTDYTFEIINANTSVFPNDFYLDDIMIFESPLYLTPAPVTEGISLVWLNDPDWKLFSSPSMAEGSWLPVSSPPLTTVGRTSIVLPLTRIQEFFRLQYSP